MPEPSEYLKDKQKQGIEFQAEDVYRETWLWLKERGCEKLISKQTLEQYAVAVSRWIQCERAVSEYGFLAKHPDKTNFAQIHSGKHLIKLVGDFQRDTHSLCIFRPFHISHIHYSYVF
jgi:hypothetical protein